MGLERRLLSLFGVVLLWSNRIPSYFICFRRIFFFGESYDVC